MLMHFAREGGLRPKRDLVRLRGLRDADHVVVDDRQVAIQPSVLRVIKG